MGIILRKAIVLNLLMICLGNYLLPSKNISFSLATNIIINPNITTPVISPQKFVNYNINQGGWTTTGLYVQYLDICMYKQNFYACFTYAGTSCGEQFLDTDSSQNNENYYQTFQTIAGNQYQLKFSWISQVSYLGGSTGISVIWNGVVVDSFFNNQCTLFTSTYYLISINGTNTISFRGIGPADGFGMLIRNINLKQLIYANATPINSTSSTNASNINSTLNTANLNPTITINLHTTASNTTNSTINSTNSTNSTMNTNNSTINNPNSNISVNSSTNLNFSNLTNNSIIPPNFTNTPIIPSLPIYNPLGNGSSYNYSINSLTNGLANYSTLADLQKMFNGTQYQNIFKFLTFLYTNKVGKLANALNSLKQSAKFAMGLMLEFNHFILYSYHLLNYTITSDMILVGMQLMDQQKGQFLDLYVYPQLNTNPQSIQRDFFQPNNLPVNSNNIDTYFHYRPNCFFLDILDTILLTIPVTAAIFILGKILFKILFKYRISLMFRSYSILGILFCIILDGKLEILTFLFLNEAFLLVTSSFEHKLKTVLIVFVYFLCLVFAASSMLVYRWVYRKLLKYVYDNCKQPLQSSFYMTVSYGLYNVMLGFLHRLLLLYPIPQICALIAFEAAYLIYITSLLFRNFYESRLLALTLCLMNSARLAFITTLLLYEMKIGEQQILCMAQQYIFYIFCGLWGLTIIFCFFYKLGLAIRIIMVQCKKIRQNKVHPLDSLEQQNHKQKALTQKVFVLTKDKNNRTRIKIIEETITQTSQIAMTKRQIYDKPQRKKSIVRKNYFTLRK